MKQIYFLLISVLFTLMLTAGISEKAQSANSMLMPYDTLSWTGAVDTNWHETGNWDPMIIPDYGIDSGHHVIIPVVATGNYPTVSNDAGARSVVLHLGASLKVESGSDLLVEGSASDGFLNYGYLYNHGNLRIDSSYNDGLLNFPDAEVVNTGELTIIEGQGKRLQNWGSILSSGTFEVLGGLDTNMINYPGATVENDNGSFTVSGGNATRLVNYGSILNSGTFSIGGSSAGEGLINKAGGQIDHTSGSFSVTNGNETEIDNFGSINSSASFTAGTTLGSPVFHNREGADFFHDGPDLSFAGGAGDIVYNDGKMELMSGLSLSGSNGSALINTDSLIVHSMEGISLFSLNGFGIDNHHVIISHGPITANNIGNSSIPVISNREGAEVFQYGSQNTLEIWNVDGPEAFLNQGELFIEGSLEIREIGAFSLGGTGIPFYNDTIGVAYILGDVTILNTGPFGTGNDGALVNFNHFEVGDSSSIEINGSSQVGIFNAADFITGEGCELILSMTGGGSIYNEEGAYFLNRCDSDFNNSSSDLVTNKGTYLHQDGSLSLSGCSLAINNQGYMEIDVPVSQASSLNTVFQNSDTLVLGTDVLFSPISQIHRIFDNSAGSYLYSDAQCSVQDIDSYLNNSGKAVLGPASSFTGQNLTTAISNTDTLINMGHLEASHFFSPMISTSGYFHNSGTIKSSFNHRGIESSGGHIENAGLMQFDSIGSYGLSLSGNHSFLNTEDGVIEMGYTWNSSLDNNSGIFDNRGGITIARQDTSYTGISNSADFYNFGSIDIGENANIGNDGLTNSSSGYFLNEGSLSIGGTGTIHNHGITNEGVFISNFCSSIDLFASVNNLDTFENRGVMEISTDSAHINTGIFTNYGELIFDPPGSIPGVIESSAEEIVFVDANATGGNSGTSWENAFTDLQDALNLCTNVSQIWVAGGVYYPTPDDLDRDSSFNLQNGVAIYGGFAGTEDSLHHRDWEANPTVLSGDINQTGDHAGNSYTVVNSSFTDTTAVLDGFSITMGNADFEMGFFNPSNSGGGIFNQSGNPRINNCVIFENTAFRGGAGVLSRDSSSIKFVNSNIHSNSTETRGGGIRIMLEANLILEKSRISGNSSGDGGGIYVDGSTFTISNTLISGNLASNHGGGVAIFNNGSGEFYNTTLSGNKSVFFGGAIRSFSGSTFKAYNSILWNNKSSGSITNFDATLIHDPIGDNPEFFNSLIANSGGSGNWNWSFATDGGGNLDLDPLFVEDFDLTDNPGTDGDFQLTSCSPAIDAGDNNALSGSDTLDLAGEPRFHNASGSDSAIVDMGAYEFQNDAQIIEVSCLDPVVYLDGQGMGEVSLTDLYEVENECGVFGISYSGPDSLVFDCDDQGAVNYQIIALDSVSLWQDSCEGTITVIDSIVPQANCRDLDLFLDADGLAEISLEDVDDNSILNCSIDTITLSQLIFDCNSLGQQTVTLTLTDNSNNTYECNSLVNVQDTLVPVFDCPVSDTIYISDGCAIVNLNYMQLLNLDANCPVNMSQFPYWGQVLTEGQYLQSVTATDNFGNSVNCNFSLYVIDTISPSIICPDDFTLYVDENCEAVLPDLTGEATASDNCGIDSIGQSPVPGTILTAGDSISVDLTVYDENGNVSNCFLSVVATDTVSPALSCPQEAIEVFVDENCEVAVGDLSGHIDLSDNCVEDFIIEQNVSSDSLLTAGESINVEITGTEISPIPFVATFSFADVEADSNHTGRTDPTPLPTIPGLQFQAWHSNSSGSFENDIPVSDGTFRFRWGGAMPLNGDFSSSYQQYQRFTIGPSGSEAISIQQFVFDWYWEGDSGSAPRKIAVRSSLDGFEENIGVASQNNHAINQIAYDGESIWFVDPDSVSAGSKTFSGLILELGPDFQHISEDVEFRLYYFGNSSSDKAAGPDNFVVSGYIQDSTAWSENCLVTVLAKDTIDPEAVCDDSPIVLAADENCEGIPGNLTHLLTATDNCLDSTDFEWSQNVPGDTVLTAGEQIIITLTVSDNMGWSEDCDISVSVEDQTDPILTCTADSVVLAVGPDCMVEAGDLAGMAVVTDNCLDESDFVLIQNIATDSLLSAGQSLSVVLTASDTSGWSDQCEIELVAENQSEFEWLSELPADSTVECGTELDELLLVVADFCDTLHISPVRDTVFGCAGVDTIISTWSYEQLTHSSIVVFEDNQAPEWISSLPADTTVECDNVPDPLVLEAADDCSEVVVAFEEINLPGADTGEYVLQRIWTAVDDCGNQAVHTQMMTVVDETPPVLICPDTVFVDAGGHCSAPVPNLLDYVVVTDNCTPEEDISLGQIPTKGLTLIHEMITVFAVAVDDANNLSFCSFTLSASNFGDDPGLSCPDPLVVEAVPGECNAYVDLSASFAEGCDGVVITNDFSSGGADASGVYPIGSTDVWFSLYEDGQLTDSCVAEVQVLDVEVPQITCPSNLTIQLDMGECDVTGPEVGEATASANCADVVVMDDAPVVFGVGETVVTHTAISDNGQTAVCQQIIAVVDINVPQIICPDDLVVQADPGECTAEGVDAGTAEVSGVCSEVTPESDAPTVFPAGITTVTHTATADNGLSSTCEQLIEVDWETNAFITCPDSVFVELEGGNCEVSNLQIPEATVTPTCAPVDISTDSPTAFFTGETLVTHTAVLPGGIELECSHVVVVSDNYAPEITCPQDMAVSVEPGLCVAGISDYGQAEATAPCSQPGVSVEAPTEFEVGVNEIVHTATADNGLIAQCTQLVTVVDDESPAIACPADTLVEIPQSQNEAFIGSLVATATDNCGVDTIFNDFNSGGADASDYYPVGSTVVEFTAVDVNSNNSSCFTTVEVQVLPDTTIFNISGTIESWAGVLLENVTVEMSGDASGSDLTDEFGEYSLSALIGSGLQIKPEKDENYPDGISVLDLVLIQQHILNINSLDSPYKIIAADVSNNGILSTFDLVIIQSLIVGLIDEFPHVDSWGFVDSDYDFSDPENPLDENWPNFRAYLTLTSDKTNQDFVAVKMGDVTGNAGQSGQRIGGSEIALHARVDKKMSKPAVVVSAGEDQTVLGYQLEFKYDSEKMNLNGLSVGHGALAGVGENSVFHDDDLGIVRLVWHSPEPVALSKGDDLFSMRLEKNGPIQLDSDRFSLEEFGSRWQSHVVMGDELELPIRMSWPEERRSERFALYQNEPNPFSQETVIPFVLPDDREVELVLYNSSGELVRKFEFNGHAGLNRESIKLEGLSPGLYLYQIRAGEWSATKRLILSGDQ